MAAGAAGRSRVLRCYIVVWPDQRGRTARCGGFLRRMALPADRGAVVDRRSCTTTGISHEDVRHGFPDCNASRCLCVGGMPLPVRGERRAGRVRVQVHRRRRAHCVSGHGVRGRTAPAWGHGVTRRSAATGGNDASLRAGEGGIPWGASTCRGPIRATPGRDVLGVPRRGRRGLLPPFALSRVDSPGWHRAQRQPSALEVDRRHRDADQPRGCVPEAARRGCDRPRWPCPR